MYGPYVQALSTYLFHSRLPPWQGGPDKADDWQTSPWEHGVKGRIFVDG